MKMGNVKIFNDNMRALKERDSELANRVISAAVNDKFELRTTGKNNQINLYSYENDTYYYDTVDIYNGIKVNIEQLNLKNTKLALFLGFGLGYELQYFADNYAEKLLTQQILVVEKDIEVFKLALQVFDYTPLFKENKIQLVVGEDAENLMPKFANYWKSINRIFLSKAYKPIYNDVSFMMNKEYYLAVIKKVNEAVIFAFSFYGNSPDDSLVGIENMLSNIREIVSNPGISYLYNTFLNKPAVVVSTGPSLNKNKHLLKEIGDKALIIAADASLKVLMDMDVKPHMVTSLERFPETAKLMEGFNLEEVKDVYYAACPVIYPTCFNVYPGPRIMVYRNFDHFKWLGIDKGTLEIKHSAGNMAFKVAAAMGCNPIILIGQDLAYGEDGNTHAKGNVYGEKQEIHLTDRQLNNLMIVPGNNGKDVTTHEDWMIFKRGYELDIAQYEGECINSTEGGAYINGTIVMSFEESISKYIKDDFHPLSIIKKELSVFSNENELEDIAKIEVKIDNTINDLNQIMEFCKNTYEAIDESQEYLRGLLETDGCGDNDSIDMDKIKDLRNIASKSYNEVFSIQPTMQLFMMHIIQSYYIKMEVELHSLPDQYDEEYKILARITLEYMRFFAILNNIAEICKGSLEKARDDLHLSR